MTSKNNNKIEYNSFENNKLNDNKSLENNSNNISSNGKSLDNKVISNNYASDNNILNELNSNIKKLQIIEKRNANLLKEILFFLVIIAIILAIFLYFEVCWTPNYFSFGLSRY